MIGSILHYSGKLLAALIGLLAGVIVLIAFSPVWAGIGLLGVQILFWLNTGAWPSFRLTDAVHIIAVDLGFMNQLKDLYEMRESLWNVLNFIPLSAFLIAAGLLLSGAIASVYDRLRERIMERKEEMSGSDSATIHVPSTATRPLIYHAIQGEDGIRLDRYYPPRIDEPSSIPLNGKQNSRTENQTSPH
jgi:hypothetical protein